MLYKNFKFKIEKLEDNDNEYFKSKDNFQSFLKVNSINEDICLKNSQNQPFTNLSLSFYSKEDLTPKQSSINTISSQLEENLQHNYYTSNQQSPKERTNDNLIGQQKKQTSKLKDFIQRMKSNQINGKVKMKLKNICKEQKQEKEQKSITINLPENKQKFMVGNLTTFRVTKNEIDKPITKKNYSNLQQRINSKQKTQASNQSSSRQSSQSGLSNNK